MKKKTILKTMMKTKKLNLMISFWISIAKLKCSDLRNRLYKRKYQEFNGVARIHYMNLILKKH